MIEIPIIRWGKPYESVEKADVTHFETGAVLGTVSQANGGLVKVDARKADQARYLLRQIQIEELLARCKKAGELFLHGDVALGDTLQNPDEFCQLQSAATGLPLHVCAANMQKIAFGLTHMDEILDALTRGLPFHILTNGYGMEDRGVLVSYQPYAPVLGAVLPSNSPGVHTLWLPAVPLQIGLMLKPGSREPWTPYRIFEALAQAGIPREVFCLYPGGSEVGQAVMDACQRSMIFGGTATVERHGGNPNVQVHGPGFSKILLGSDLVDRWEEFLDLMVTSVLANCGRSCINCSGIWAPRHGRAIAEALAARLGPMGPRPVSDPQAALAAFTDSAVAQAMNDQIEQGCQAPGVIDVAGSYRDGPRLVQQQRCSYLRPTVLHCADPAADMANTEFIFPFVAVVDCPQQHMLRTMGPTLVCTAITEDAAFLRKLLDATDIDRLNLGPIPTVQLNWLQPHEGNLIDFLFRSRAFQRCELSGE